MITVEIAFIHSSSEHYYYEDFALRYHDKFINCSVNSDDVFIQWDYKNMPLWTNNEGKYSQNSTGLTIHNITEDDYGNYTCFINEDGKLLNATISLTIMCKIYLHVCVCKYGL